MEEVFYNGVNFTRAVLARTCNLEGLGTLGQMLVLENLISPMLDYLYENASVVVIDGEMVDVLTHRLDEEDYQIPAEAAARAVEQLRTVARLIDECNEAPKKLMRQGCPVMVISASSLEEAMTEVRKHVLESLGEAAPNAEYKLAETFAELYDEWCEEDLGELHPMLYVMLRIGQNVCETALEKLDGHELNPDEVWLQREGYEALESVNERLDELLMDYPEYCDEEDDDETDDDAFDDEPFFPYS